MIGLALVIQLGGGASLGYSEPSYTFNDEFSGNVLNSVWGRHWGWLGESRFTRDLATVGGGVLSLSAQRQEDHWRSGLVDTSTSFRQLYGHFEARIRIPQGYGLWPAFWVAQGWEVDGPAEIDMMEVCANPPASRSGNDVSRLHERVHFAGGGLAGNDARTKDLSQGWHVYGMDWRADHVTFLLDGAEVWTYGGADVPSVPMPLVLDLAVGGSWCGPSEASTPDPAEMLVDWVRVTN